jgi:phage terminase large subunit
MSREIVIKPNPKQLLFLKSKKRHIAFGGARGGGKSWSIRTKAVLLANRYAGIKILIVRRTLVELRNNHIEPMKSMLLGIAKYNQQERKFIFPNGSTISFEYYDAEKDHMKYMGVEYDIIFIDEATQFKEEWLKIIASCCRNTSDIPTRIYMTCNPGGVGHAYIKRLFIDKQYRETENPEDYEFIQSLVTENKTLMEHSPEYISFLKNLPPKLKKAWLYGDWDIFDGAYFEEFRNDPEHYDDRMWTHVINPFRPKSHWPIYRSFDWGYAKPFSCGWWTVDDDGTIYRICELYGVQYSGQEPIPNQGVKWPVEKVFAEIQKMEREHPYLAGKRIGGVADPAIWKAEGGVSIAETATHYGIFFQKADNERIPGWLQMHYRFMFDENGFPRMYIFNTCKNFIRTITTLQYDPHKAEDLDSDGEDHAADETRYFCQSRPIKPYLPEETFTPAWGNDPLEQFTERRRR